MKITKLLTINALFTLIFAIATTSVFAQTAAFTYQGRLTDGGTPANGVYDLQFALFDSAASGAQIGSSQTVSSVSVSAGIFTVLLDFGTGAFTGPNRYLEISARQAGIGSFTQLTPRQQITSTPYAVRSFRATLADGLSGACTGCVGDSNINAIAGSKVSGTIPLASVPAGSASYIQNTSSPQSGNFNISGTGTAHILNADTQYNLNGQRILYAAGSNVFVGVGNGPINTGTNNSFFGLGAGSFNASSGSDNAFFGTSTGGSNTGSVNSFFGSFTGVSNTSGSSNTFFGANAGFLNTSASNNAFFGALAGNENMGDSNAFFGSQAGLHNTNGRANAFFGTYAGFSHTTTDGNSYFGYQTGYNGTVGGDGANSYFGYQAGYSNTTGGANSFFGAQAGRINSSGSANSFFGTQAGLGTTTGDSNTFVGQFAGDTNKTGSLNTIIGKGADVGADNLNHATAIGADAVVNTSNTILLGREDGSDFVRVPGFLTIPNLAVAGSTQLCRNSFDRVGSCSSSLRYKTDLAPYRSGLNVINRLRPLSFTWKDGGLRDLGFGAEEVEKVDPLLVTYNQHGQVEGVKYDRINVVLVNAIKEQQQQIEEQQQQLRKQQSQIEELKRVLCRNYKKSRVGTGAFCSSDYLIHTVASAR